MGESRNHQLQSSMSTLWAPTALIRNQITLGPRSLLFAVMWLEVAARPANLAASIVMSWRLPLSGQDPRHFQTTLWIKSHFVSREQTSSRNSRSKPVHPSSWGQQQFWLIITNKLKCCDRIIWSELPRGWRSKFSHKLWIIKRNFLIAKAARGREKWEKSMQQWAQSRGLWYCVDASRSQRSKWSSRSTCSGRVGRDKIIYIKYITDEMCHTTESRDVNSGCNTVGSVKAFSLSSKG